MSYELETENLSLRVLPYQFHELVNYDELLPPQKFVRRVPEKRRKTCGQYLMYNTRTKTYWQHRCNLRTCQRIECRKIYAWKRQQQIKDVAELNNLDKFITLTLDQKKFASAKDAWSKIAHIWEKFRKRLVRKHRGIKFICILEKHKKNNFPHIHGLIRWTGSTGKSLFIDKEWVDKNWEECGGGSVCEVEQVVGDISGYLSKSLNISKYFGKGNLDISRWVSPRQRVMWMSRGLLQTKREKNPDVHMLGVSGKGIRIDEKYVLNAEDINRSTYIPGAVFRARAKFSSPYNIDGNLVWTPTVVEEVLEEVCEEEDYSFFERAFYGIEEGWHEVVGACDPISQESNARRKENLRQDRGFQSYNKVFEIIEIAKRQDKRKDKNTEGKVRYGN